MKCVSQAGRERLEAAVDDVVRLPNGAWLAVERRPLSYTGAVGGDDLEAC
jgi:hypothetical protein